MEHHLRPLLIIAILALLLAGAGYMLWPQASEAPTIEGALQTPSTSSKWHWVSLAASSTIGRFSVADGKVVFNGFFNEPTTTVYDSNPADFFVSVGPNDAVKDYEGFAKDNTGVYAVGRYNGATLPVPVDGADPATFQSIGWSVGEDKNGFWFDNFKLPFSIDPNTFTELGVFDKDASHVYFINLIDAEIVPQFDAPSFQELNLGYSKDKQGVWFGDPISGLNLIQGADPTTFTVGGDGVTYDAQDKNHKYLQGQIVQDSSVITTILDTKGNPSDYFSKGGMVYWNGGSDDPNYRVLVSGADPATFVALASQYGPPDFAKDKNHGYYGNQIITNYPNTFGPLSFGVLYSDGHQVFDAWGKVISDDAQHFVSVNIPQSQFLCAKDSASFYLCSNQSSEIHAISGSDPATFGVLKNSNGQDSLYAKDKNLVYWFGEPDGLPAPNVTVVSNADPATFVVGGDGSTYDAQDKNHQYSAGSVVQ